MFADDHSFCFKNSHLPNFGCIPGGDENDVIVGAKTGLLVNLLNLTLFPNLNIEPNLPI